MWRGEGNVGACYGNMYEGGGKGRRAEILEILDESGKEKGWMRRLQKKEGRGEAEIDKGKGGEGEGEKREKWEREE